MVFGIPFWMIITALVAGLAVAMTLYFRNKTLPYPKPLKVLLFMLRAMSVSLVVLLLFNPFVHQDVKQVDSPIILLLHDDSRSLAMTSDSSYYRGDYRQHYSDLKAQLADVATVDAYVFGAEVRRDDTLKYEECFTDISSALLLMKQRYYRRNVAAVVLLSDGIYNRGVAPELVSQQYPFPIYTVLLGDSTLRPDLAVAEVQYNKEVQRGMTTPIRYTLSAMGCQGAVAEVVVKVDGVLLERREVKIPSHRYSKDCDFYYEAEEVGVRHFEVIVTATDGELTLQNNSRDFFVEVVDKTAKVLVLASAPHPDISALCVAMGDSYETTYVFGNERLPDFSAFDLVIAYKYPCHGADVGVLYERLQASPMIPIWYFVGADTDCDALSKVQKSFTFRKGAPMTVFDVKARPNSSFVLFSLDADKADKMASFPPLNVPYVESIAQEAHDDLLLQVLTGGDEAFPMMSFVHPAGGRKEVFMMGSDIWRWRLYDYYSNKSHEVFDGLVQKTVSYLLSTSSDELKVYCRDVFMSHENIMMSAELMNSVEELVNDPEVTIRVVNKLNDEEYDYVFSRDDRAYVLDVGRLPQGLYHYEARASLGERSYRYVGDFSVGDVGVEEMTLVADAARMKMLAMSTGGRFYLRDEMSGLSEDLVDDGRLTTMERREHRFEDMFHFVGVLGVLLTLLALEWILRKRYGRY